MGYLIGVFVLDIIAMVLFIFQAYTGHSEGAVMVVSIMVVLCFILTFVSLFLFVQKDEQTPPDVLTYLFSLIGIGSVAASLFLVFGS